MQLSELEFNDVLQLITLCILILAAAFLFLLKIVVLRTIVDHMQQSPQFILPSSSRWNAFAISASVSFGSVSSTLSR